MSNYIIECCNISKSFSDGANRIDVLKQLSMQVASGDKIAIVGPSGSGKSTLLHLLGGLDNPNAGNVYINGKSWAVISEKQRCQERNTELGFIYQFHHLLPEFNAIENTAMPLLLRNNDSESALQAARGMLNKVGLGHRILHKPAELSGGERARVAIARALVHKPKCILADEPTGNLDQKTANSIFDLMLEINAEANTALVIVTHDEKIAAKTQQVLTLDDGKFNCL